MSRSFEVNSGSRAIAKLCWCVLVVWTAAAGARDEGARHYVFFGRDRERTSEEAFLGQKAFEGAQLKYTWRQLEQGKDGYDFADIQHDLAFLNSKGKKLFIQIQDASFDINIRPFPRYLLRDPSLPRGRGQTVRRGQSSLRLDGQAMGQGCAGAISPAHLGAWPRI